jgi:hypothetical protein
MFSRGCPKQPLETAAQVSGLADVRLRLRIVAAKEKHRRRWWDCSERFGVTGRDELLAVAEHPVILRLD